MADPWRLDALVLPLTAAAKSQAQSVARDLRRAGLVADLPYTDRTLNGHMKAAARAGPAPWSSWASRSWPPARPRSAT